MSTNRSFSRFSQTVSAATGKPWAFGLAALSIVVWAITGPMFHFSETWQLVVNTGTTIITFLMVFLIQSTQNRDTSAMHIKLDEIIRALDGAENKLMKLEEADDATLDALKHHYQTEAERAHAGQTPAPPEVIAAATSACTPKVTDISPAATS